MLRVLTDFLRLRARSFRFAFQGWWYVLRTQPNAWIHALASALVFALAALLQLNRRDWAILIVVIGMVWMGEFLNTALEAVIDAMIPYQHPLAKVGKDVAAAAVLIAALTSVLVGLLILGPPLLARLGL